MILDRSPGACYETMGMFRHVQEEPDLPDSVFVIVRGVPNGAEFTWDSTNSMYRAVIP